MNETETIVSAALQTTMEAAVANGLIEVSEDKKFARLSYQGTITLYYTFTQGLAAWRPLLDFMTLAAFDMVQERLAAIAATAMKSQANNIPMPSFPESNAPTQS